MDPLSPVVPTITANSTEQAVWEIVADLEVADRHAKNGAEMYRKVGVKLAQLKEQLGSAFWSAVENKMKRSRRQVYRWLALAKCDVNVTLDDQWALICGNKDKELEPQQVTSPTLPADEPIACRACRVGGKLCPEHQNGQKPSKAPSKPVAASEETEGGTADDEDDKAEATAKAASAKQTREANEKQGRERITLKVVTDHLGPLVRSLDRVEEDYKCKGQLDDSRKLLSDFLKMIKSLWKELPKE